MPRVPGEAPASPGAGARLVCAACRQTGGCFIDASRDGAGFDASRTAGFQAASWNLWPVRLRVFKALKYSFFTKLWRRTTSVGAVSTDVWVPPDGCFGRFLPCGASCRGGLHVRGLRLRVCVWHRRTARTPRVGEASATGRAQMPFVSPCRQLGP